MKQSLFVVIIVSILSISCQDQATNNPSPLTEKLDSLIDSEHKVNGFAGTVTIGTRDTILYEKAIGLANRMWEIPLEMRHHFDICSLNKSFISALILMSVQEEKLSLDDRLADLLDGYELTGSFHPDITIHQMLSHTSGLGDYGVVDRELSSNNFRLFKRKHFTNNEYVDFISQLPIKGQPGEQFYYSNFSYHLLAIILEDVYQAPFSEILEEKLCKPLGMAETFSSSSNEELHPEMAEGYSYEKSTDRWVRNQFIDLTIGRRIFSTSGDLYKWGKAMSSDVLLDPDLRKRMLTNHVTDITQEISYGYGWVIFDGEHDYRMGNLNIDKPYIIHGGNTEGYKSMLINIADGEYIIAFLSNTGNQTNEMKLAQSIVNILLYTTHEN